MRYLIAIVFFAIISCNRYQTVVFHKYQASGEDVDKGDTVKCSFYCLKVSTLKCPDENFYIRYILYGLHEDEPFLNSGDTIKFDYKKWRYKLLTKKPVTYPAFPFTASNKP